jgi:hypothetical protein
MAKYNQLENLILISSITGNAIDTTNPGNGIDTLGYEDLLVLAGVGIIAATAVVTLSVQHSDDDGVGDAYANVTGAVISPADSDDGTLYVGKVRLNTAGMKRWIRAHAIVATAVGDYYITCLAYNKGGHLPVVNALEFDINLGV